MFTFDGVLKRYHDAMMPWKCCLHHWPLWGKSTGHWRITLTTGQWWRCIWCLDCLLSRLFWHRSKKTSKLRISGLWEGESTGDWWIPLTKGQWCGKCSHLMTFSWFSLVESLRKLLNKQSNCQWFVTDAMMPIWSHCNVIKGPSPLTHYSDVIMSTMRLKSPASRLFAQPFFWGTQIKENSKAPRHRPLCGESTSDQWIPFIGGQ